MTRTSPILADRVLLDLIERLEAVRDILEQNPSETALTHLQVLGDNALREAIDYFVELRAERLAGTK